MKELQIKELYKRFGKTEAVRGLNLTLTQGVHGLLGPNGAGKTTLMKCILDLYQYQGSITFLENDQSMQDYTTGYLPQHFDMLGELSVIEAMEYIGTLKQVRKGRPKKTYEELLALVNLQDEQNKKVKNLSGGMKRRLGIAQALIGQPDVLIIDEPTAGLDPGERISFRNLLVNLSGDFVVILSTHIVEDISGIADSVAIMKKGRVLVHGTLDELRSHVDKNVGEMVVDQAWISSHPEIKIIMQRKQEEMYYIRFMADKLPEGAKRCSLGLEEIYHYYVGAYRS